MSNQKIKDLPEMSFNALDTDLYYLMVEREDGSLGRIKVKDALKASHQSNDLNKINFLNEEKQIYFSESETIDRKSFQLDLSQYGVPKEANSVLVSCTQVGGHHPYFDVTFGGIMRTLRRHGRAHHWTAQVFAPVDNSVLDTYIKYKTGHTSFRIRLHAYA